MSLSLGSGSDLLNFFKASSLPNFNRIVERAILILEDYRFEDIFSIAGTNLRAWLNVAGRGAKDVSAE
jgi:hypothetical protein